MLLRGIQVTATFAAVDSAAGPPLHTRGLRGGRVRSSVPAIYSHGASERSAHCHATEEWSGYVLV